MLRVKSSTVGALGAALLVGAAVWSAGCGSETENIAPTGGGMASVGGAAGSGGVAPGGAGGAGATGGEAGGTACVPEDELCDGLDNDCDEEVDEDCPCIEGEEQDCYTGDPALLGIGVCAEGVQTCDLQGSWGPCEGDVLPTEEACDGLDNDCDDAVDEDLDEITCGVGICQVTVPACQDGQPVPCLPGSPEPPEDCDGLDDNCDSLVDEGCDCVDDGQQDCYTGSSDTRGVGECHDGVQTCSGGTWGPCANDQTPELDVCDGLDNDCDTLLDEHDPADGAACSTGLDGVCGAGTYVCANGLLACEQDEQPSAELCDDLDNDCEVGTPDGTDEPTLNDPCDGSDGDYCDEGVLVCTGGELSCTDATGNTLDVCDGQDNDCDVGSSDGAEDPQSGTPCDGPDGDLCIEGMRICVAGSLACGDNTADSPDVCDGVDNDCDGASADGAEDPAVGTTCDGVDGDLCKEGTFSCVAGGLVCSDVTPDLPDVCDGQDNDCDPASADGDEDPQRGVACDGADSDLCKEGAFACDAGSLSCSDDSSDTLDVCDGLNNDCDPASADGSEDSQVNTPCDGADVDLCEDGLRICAGGALSCDDGPGTGLDICDGVDNDCNAGTADGSQDPLVGTTCDGPDSDLCKEGSYSCSAGALVCSDTTGPTLDLCDGVDNDCDPASIDGSEDALVGVPCDGPDGDLCKEGASACAGGAVACSDATATTLDLCDGQDNDCDPASADGSEDPQNGQACDGTDSDLCLEGTRSCSSGALVCSDATGSTVDLCNGANDDCDPASADGSEDALVGVACDGTDTDLCTEGLSSCSAGAVQCSDVTGSTVDLCNGADDDCDAASADGSEDPAVGTSCDGTDSDLCLEGTRLCVGGALACNDMTGSTVDLCDGVDNDCDAGSADGSEDAGVGVSCDGADGDLCKEGTSACVTGSLACSDATGNTLDVCDGQDNDCDAASADGSEDPLNGGACDGPDSDLCTEGTRSCLGGSLLCSDDSTDTLDVCDGQNNDCDATSADGAEDAQVGTACDGSDVDLCPDGQRICSGGVLSCNDGSETGLDICDGVDNDCNAGTADGSQDPLVGTGCDGADSDLCQEGTYSCSTGALLCSDSSGPSLDVCDGLDNDCDPASADGAEDVLVGVSCDGADGDLCKEGTSSCSGGGIVCSDATATTVDLCDGQDNDCDPASVDGSEDPQTGQACDGADTDLCLEGSKSCSGGALVCSDSTGSTVDLCNGANDDCDSSSADGSEDVLVGVSCDGADSDLCNEGTTACTTGSVVCSDATASAVDLCNGMDDDCDPASVDGAEDPQNGAPCDGVDTDLCLEGSKSCSSGALLCDDTSGSSTDICNGMDDDCDPASADGTEDPLWGAACDGVDSDLCAEGTYSCPAGSLACSDTSGSTIEVCDNGLDEDCNGVADNGCCPGTLITIPPGATSVTGDTCSSSNRYSASCGGGAGSPDDIYVYTAPASGTVSFSTCGGASYDTTLHVRTDCATPSSEIACNDDDCADQSEISFEVVAGSVYYVTVDGYGSGNCGGYTLYITDPSGQCGAGTYNCDADNGNGCECTSGSGCCGAACQNQHSAGFGAYYYDCVALGTYNMTQAFAACEASDGAGNCVDTNCSGGRAVCSSATSNCRCWSYSGGSAGRAMDRAGSGSCQCASGSTSGVPWN